MEAQPGPEPQTKAPEASPTELLIASVESYLERTWKAADALLGIDGLGLFAVGRAYYGLFNVAIASVLIMRLDLTPYQGGSDHHKREISIPHTQLPVLVSNLVGLQSPPKKLGVGQRSEEQTEAFSLARQLQKLRKRSDYMGTEVLEKATAADYVQRSKELTIKIWRYACDHKSG